MPMAGTAMGANRKADGSTLIVGSSYWTPDLNVATLDRQGNVTFPEKPTPTDRSPRQLNLAASPRKIITNGTHRARCPSSPTDQHDVQLVNLAT